MLNVAKKSSLLIIIILVSKIASCFAYNFTQINIGIIGEFAEPTSGYDRKFGEEVYSGATLALKQLKQQNSKFKFKLIKLETNNLLANIPIIIKLAAKRGIHIFIGLGTADEIYLATKSLKSTNSLLISPTGSYNNNSNINNDRVITFFPSMTKMANKISEYLLKKGIKKLTIIYTPDKFYSKKMTAAFKKIYIKFNGEIIAVFPVYSGQISINQYLKQLIANKHNYIFLPVTDIDAAKIITQFKLNNIEATFIGSDSWATYSTYVLKRLNHLMVENHSNAIIPIMYDRTINNRTNRIFIDQYKQEYKDTYPTDMEAFSYDSILILHKMIQICGLSLLEDSPLQCLNKSLPFDTTTGIISKIDGVSLCRRIFMKDIKI